MKKTKQFKRTALPLSAKSMVSTLLLLIAMLMPQGVWAISGSGTSSSPYLIANEADLRTFQQYVENGNSGIYGKLTADITLTSAWTRIGRSGQKFTGYFDGQGHTISGMNLSFTAYEHGFFGFVNNATIKNFTLKGTMTSSANGNHSHGTVVGSAAGTTVIENVTSSVNLTLNHTGFTCIGGIVGHMDESSKVIGCTYTGTINLNKDSEQVGGIVGYAQRNLYITNNVFSGTITSTGKCKYLAGIAGKTDGTIEVSGCTNIGTINGGPSYDCVAGIVGYVNYQSQALITNCYFGGSLSSTSSGTSLVMGGILGAVNDEKGGNFRGLTYCFSDGTLTATSSSSTQIGGIAGVVKHKAVSMVTNNTYLSGKASRISAIDGSLSFDSSNKAITISVTAGTGGTVKKSYVYPTSTAATQLQVVATPNSGYHYVEWSDNGAQTHNVSLANNVSLTATFGAHTYGNWSTDVDATCTSAGTHHRVCTYAGCGAREDGTIAALGHGSTGYNESYSWTGNAYNDASKDTKACIFTLTCKKCSTKVVNGASLTCIKTAHVDATCRATGSTTYQATGSYTAANSAYNYHATKTNIYTVVALGHGTTGYTESYVWTGNAYNDWSQDTKRCTFTLTCKNCSTKVVNGASLTCIKTAHVDASCTATGSTTYMATGSYTAANSAYNYSAIKTNVYTVAALGHGSTGYTPTYTWGETYDDATCTFTLQCGSCGVEVFNDNITTTKVDANHVDATCGKDGNERWTATGSYSKAGDATYNGEAQVKDYVIPATGLHTFDDETDPYHTLCTVCDHSFFRYTATEKVEPSSGTLRNGSNRDIYNKNKHTFDGENGVMEFDEPLVVIFARAFYQCSAFTGDLIIPKSVKEIGWLAFSECSFTGNLVIGNDVTTIARLAFETASFKGTLTIGNSVRTIEKSTFAGCGFKGDLIIPNSVTNIGESAFCDCSGFGSLTIGNSVEIIGTGAFRNCTGVKGNLTLGKSVKKIDDGAFRNLRNLSSIQLQSIPQTYENTFLYTDCTKTVVLSDDSYVYTEENPYFPTVASVTAPCTLDLTRSAVENHANLTINHNYTNNTLTPIEDGLYAYACDNGCGTHSDDHIIKDFYGEGNHLELTKDGEGNYSTSEDIIINDCTSFSSPVDFTAPSVTFDRYIINDGGMWSFIVPFDIPAAQAAQLGTFYQYRTHGEGKVHFDNIARVGDGIVRANTAYFFEPATDFTSITVDDAEIKATTSMPNAENPSEPGLYGTYSQIDIPVGAYGYYMWWGESTFVKAGTGNLLRSCRAYLWLDSDAYMARAHAIRGQQKGDVNGDGKISLADLTLLVEILNGDATDTTGAADLDGKNGVTIDDLEILRNYILEDDGQTPEDPTPAGFSINYDDEDEVPTVTNHIWDR